MSNLSNLPNTAPQVIYEADRSHMEAVNAVREKLHHICKNKIMNRYVKVRTLEGHEYEGIVVFVDHGNLYLSLAEDEAAKRSYYQRFTPYPVSPYGYGYPAVNPGGAILPLVLFNLLTISLLY